MTESEGDETRTPESEILRARARALAREPHLRDAAEERFEALEFRLGGERYALGSAWVREVYPLKELTELPCTPPFVLGILNIRGQILSVLDLEKFFGLPQSHAERSGKVIVLHGEGLELGIRADAITGVSAIPLREIQPPLPTLSATCADYLMGVTNEQIAILDVGKILSDRRLVVNDEIEA
jgi:purine-binding chemotaxis protein CheW